MGAMGPKADLTCDSDNARLAPRSGHDRKGRALENSLILNPSSLFSPPQFLVLKSTDNSLDVPVLRLILTKRPLPKAKLPEFPCIFHCGPGICGEDGLSLDCVAHHETISFLPFRLAPFRLANETTNETFCDCFRGNGLRGGARILALDSGRLEIVTRADLRLSTGDERADVHRHRLCCDRYC